MGGDAAAGGAGLTNSNAAPLTNAARAALGLLFVLVPFEPRFTIPLGPLRLSLLEAVALPAFALLAIAFVRADVFRWPPAVLSLAIMTAAAMASSALAVEDPARSLKFSLRIGAMTVMAALASHFDERGARIALRALAIAGSAAAALAILEGAGMRQLDVFLGAFREIPFNVAGVRRATAGSEYPNLGAAMIAYALLAGVALLRDRNAARAIFTAVLTCGLAFTYSRGAWIAAVAGLVTIASFERSRARWIPLAVGLSILCAFLGVKEISQVRLGGENANDFYAATYRTQEDIALKPSELTMVEVAVTNTGRRPWRKTEEIHLSYHLYEDAHRPLVDGPRTDLPKDVLPGESVTITARLRAPLREGAYVLMWDLVHEDTTWFSGQGVRPGVARLTVGDDASTSSTVSKEAGLRRVSEGLAWRPSRVELWSIALDMWASHPLLGVGPDAFRWSYGRSVGRDAFDTRVFANNTVLEFAATLGSLGLAAWLAAVALALRSRVRRARESPAALASLAILIAILVHGLADHLLAFTGHYLVFALAIGIESGAPTVTRNGDKVPA